MGHDEPHYKSNIFNKQSENQKGNKNETRSLPYARTKTTTKPFFFSNVHPFLTRTLGAFPCVTEGRQRLLCMLSKKRTRPSSFLSSQTSFTFTKLQLFETPSSKRQTKLQPFFLFVCRIFFNLFFFISSCPFYRVKR